VAVIVKRLTAIQMTVIIILNFFVGIYYTTYMQIMFPFDI